MSTYTVYTTYALVSTGNTTVYNSAIHCNYINTMQIVTDNLTIQEIRINFANTGDFKFLKDDISSGQGFTANRIYVIVQVIENVGTIIPKPVSSNWKYLDVTSQIIGYTDSHNYLTANELLSVVFKVPLNNYNNYPQYNLSYLTYPFAGEDTMLSFGDESYFFGNVSVDIFANVYSTDISINLPLNQFNSTTNNTWNGIEKVYISEVGIYAEVEGVKYLVGIGKLNDPVPKDSTISRTILFAIDF